MKELLKEIKPYWKIVIVTMLFHLVRVYGTLLLPDYTSQLIDVGITNNGFEYAAPITMTAETHDGLQSILLPEERDAMDAAYEEEADGTYRLDEAIEENRKEMTALSDTLRQPVAFYQLAINMPDEQREEFMQSGDLDVTQMATAEPSVWRPEVDERLETLGTSVLQGAATQLAKDEYEATGGDSFRYQMGYLTHTGLIMLVVTLMTVIGALGGHYFASTTGAKVGYSLRQRTFEKVLAFSQSEINHFSTASLITRSTNDIQQIQLVTTLMLRVVLYSPMLAIGAALRIIMARSPLTWVVWLATALVMAIMLGLTALTMPRFKRLQKQIDRINLVAREVLTGLPVIRAFGRQDVESERFEEASTELKETYLFTNRLMSLMRPTMMIVMNFTSLLIVWAAASYVGDGLMQVGEMTAAINYIMQMIFSFILVSIISMQIPRAAVSAERVNDVLTTVPSIRDPEDPVFVKDKRGEIVFDHVDFAFDGADHNTLEDINFTAEPGKTTAIIGGTGSGKSTLLNLMLRFYDVSSGRITIDGVDIREMTLDELASYIGLVSQEAILFSGTVTSNIAYSDEDMKKKDVKKAARIAHADEFIEQMEERYGARIAQGGANVSGGQKQRLSIARAIAKDPKIFLFDDSFSALDYRTDASLRQALDENLSEAVTTIIVAQRVSTILDADQIIVLDQGRIDGIGTHLELMNGSEIYREIATSQLSRAELDAQEEKELARRAEQGLPTANLTTSAPQTETPTDDDQALTARQENLPAEEDSHESETTDE